MVAIGSRSKWEGFHNHEQLSDGSPLYKECGHVHFIDGKFRDVDFRKVDFRDVLYSEYQKKCFIFKLYYVFPILIDVKCCLREDFSLWKVFSADLMTILRIL
jgi:hypothetical protein